VHFDGSRQQVGWTSSGRPTAASPV
jgi:hypothetical protein